MCNVYCCCADNKRMSTSTGGLYWRISRMPFDIIPADFSFLFSCFYMGDIRQYNNPISLQSFEQGERRHRRSGDVWRFLIQKDWLLIRVGLKIGKADAMGRRINAEWVSASYADVLWAFSHGYICVYWMHLILMNPFDVTLNLFPPSWVSLIYLPRANSILVSRWFHQMRMRCSPKSPPAYPAMSFSLHLLDDSNLYGRLFVLKQIWIFPLHLD